MKRAVAYIRVSTASDAQVHSFEFQEDYWKNEINKNDDLTLVEIYADKGISGKSLSKSQYTLIGGFIYEYAKINDGSAKNAS